MVALQECLHKLRASLLIYAKLNLYNSFFLSDGPTHHSSGVLPSGREPFRVDVRKYSWVPSRVTCANGV
jgi:hypothetical protein